MQPTIERDALVIGVGEAGTLVASLAVDAGASVALAYRERWGSTCLNAGCVPSKFLIHRARVAHVVRTSERFGVRADQAQVDLAGIVEEKRRYLDRHRDESWQGALREQRLTLLEGPRSSSPITKSGSAGALCVRGGSSSPSACVRRSPIWTGCATGRC
jgi:pyruvate/2-oxoglutarate dehydrogenase complex dihydrolipoamide dehydrogenase (E3) component